MREFQGKGSTLHRMSPASRALYGGYLALTLAGFGTALALYWDSMGFSPAGAAQHILGNADDPQAMDIVLDKSPRQLLEGSHQHLFTMPVAMLIIGHLFLLSRGGGWKAWVVAATPVLLGAHVAGPWVLHYGGAWWGWWMPATAVPYVAVMVFMALWTVPDLLRRPEAP